MKLKVAILQTHVFADKEKNIRQLEEILAAGKTAGADLVTLPEMFACPYETPNFPRYAEPEGGPTWQALSALAKKYGIYLSAGSMPELDMVSEGGTRSGNFTGLASEVPSGCLKKNVYNTAYVFDRQGRQIGKHRKAHLFDIDVKGGQYFKESDTLSPGDHIGCFDTEFGRIGLCICYDFRFPETARLMAQDGAKIILVPAAFNMTTGPAHWELMFRGRAVESQCYVIGTAPARDLHSSYISWGHSIVVDPWGRILTQMDEKEGIRIVELDLDYVEEVRQELPLLKHRRTDLYELRRV
jgi:predicted amidohydrolase